MKLREWICFLALTLIWGSSFLWIKLAVQEVGPFTVVTLRLFMALLALIPFLMARKPGVPRSAVMCGILLLQGLLVTAIPWLLITWAEQYIDSALAAVFNGTVPLFTVVLAHFFLHDDKMTAKRVAGILVGLVGVVVLVRADLFALISGEGTSMLLLGQAAMLVSSLSYGIGHVFARAKLRGVPTIFQTFYTMLAADAIMWLVTPAVETPFRLPGGAITWIAIAWLGILGAGIAHLLFYYLLHSIGPTRVAMVTYTIPVVGVFLGVVFLNEALSWSLVAGAILIVIGVCSVTSR